ncbi:MAG: bifunctional methylenetetrahydrofolate dehydrogenase/methenyltetrahydrofolate cyclohydrolase FolD [Alphaproteobacteria bacterium]|nr:bifunctional methylenetetrahydrofolate dehydrogenase/methenyltetrahydrofolate cyclohydrolase FolD [Alphaproteobacteria bacterium]
MTAAIIDGKAFAEGLRARVGAAAATFRASHGLVPGLAVVLVGADPASQVYVRSKTRAAEPAGLAHFDHHLPASTPQAELEALVARLNADDAVDGILVQLPLPKGLDSTRVIAAIDPAKDVDGLNVVNTGLLASGNMDRALVPCTPLGSLMLLKDRLGDLSGADAIVVGRSVLVGRPMAQLLIGENCTVTVAHSRTRDLSARCRAADILVAAVGRPEMVRGDWVKPGATVIDVGINRVAAPTPEKPDDTKLVGDVAFAEAQAVAGAITPVPGGVGPMTIACLLANTVTAACRRRGVAVPPQLASR